MSYKSTYGKFGDFEVLGASTRLKVVSSKRYNTEILNDGKMIDHYEFIFHIPEINKYPSIRLPFNVDENKWATKFATCSNNFPKDFHVEAFHMVEHIVL